MLVVVAAVQDHQDRLDQVVQVEVVLVEHKETEQQEQQILVEVAALQVVRTTPSSMLYRPSTMQDSPFIPWVWRSLFSTMPRFCES